MLINWSFDENSKLIAIRKK